MNRRRLVRVALLRRESPVGKDVVHRHHLAGIQQPREVRTDDGEPVTSDQTRDAVCVVAGDGQATLVVHRGVGTPIGAEVLTEHARRRRRDVLGRRQATHGIVEVHQQAIVADVLHHALHAERQPRGVVPRSTTRRDPSLAAVLHEAVLHGVVAMRLERDIDGEACPIAIVGVQPLADGCPADGLIGIEPEDLCGAWRARDQVGLDVPAPVAEPSHRHGEMQPFGIGVGGRSRRRQGRIGFAALGDVDPEPIEPERCAVVTVDRPPASIHPAPATGRVAESELDDVVGAGGQRTGHGGIDAIAIVGMDEGEEPRLGAGEAAGRQAEDLLEFPAPPDLVGREVARPCAHPACTHRQGLHLLASAQRLAGAPVRGGLREEDGEALDPGIQPVLEASSWSRAPGVERTRLAADERGLQVGQRLVEHRLGEDVLHGAPDHLVARDAQEALGGLVHEEVPQVRVEGDQPLADGRDDAVEHDGASQSYGSRRCPPPRGPAACIRPRHLMAAA